MSEEVGSSLFRDAMDCRATVWSFGGLGNAAQRVSLWAVFEHYAAQSGVQPRRMRQSEPLFPGTFSESKN